ncbi:Uncharacterised protein [Klebsiella pneumoniae subsp. ozaenae]|uniref:Uncharacterized protein n=1 Tax=Klebsiella pneumoniae subsp. ozaenae TaxID=574 RepID=A0A378BYP2_KLEPO|nr:Uncharacterised protein [Klebsiella pneumoniae subsp. ozaenae]
MPKPATQLEFLALCFELPDLDGCQHTVAGMVADDSGWHFYWPGWSFMD